MFVRGDAIIRTGFLDKAKAILTLYRTKRRYMEYFFCMVLFTIFELIAMFQQIDVFFTKGIPYLAYDRTQATICAMAKPKRHRIEDVTKYARKALQPDFAFGIVDVFSV